MRYVLLLWLVAATVAFLRLIFASVEPRPRPSLLIVAVGVVTYGLPLLLYPQAMGWFALDLGHYETTADKVLQGLDVYPGPRFIHPYLPFQMYILAICKWIAAALGVSFFTVLRIPQAAAAIGTGLLVHRALASDGDPRALRAGLATVVCPLTVVVTVYHGQFDVLSVFFALAAVLVVTRGISPRNISLSAAFLALGVLQKLWPVFLGPLILARLGTVRDVLRYGAICGGIVALSVVSYLVVFNSNLGLMIEKSALYSTPLPGSGGVVLVLDRLAPILELDASVRALWIYYGKTVTLIAVVAATGLAMAWYLPLVEAVVLVLCSLFTVVPDGSSYHYTWIIPFGIVAGHRWPVAALTVAATTSYIIVGFFRGGLYLEGLYVEPTSLAGPSSNYQSIPSVASWLTFACWGAWIVARTIRSRHKAATSPRPSLPADAS